MARQVRPPRTCPWQVCPFETQVCHRPLENLHTNFIRGRRVQLRNMRITNLATWKVMHACERHHSFSLTWDMWITCSSAKETKLHRIHEHTIVLVSRVTYAQFTSKHAHRVWHQTIGSPIKKITSWWGVRLRTRKFVFKDLQQIIFTSRFTSLQVSLMNACIWYVNKHFSSVMRRHDMNALADVSCSLLGSDHVSRICSQRSITTRTLFHDTMTGAYGPFWNSKRQSMGSIRDFLLMGNAIWKLPLWLSCKLINQHLLLHCPFA